MGRKVKIGKRRKDKFYHLAKETGYRARSAFKLIQLNRKYHFLQQCRVLVDLCAAPGGWLQVAAKFMPISSLVIGVDLVPIKSIPNVITLQEDITTERCKQQLQRELKTWKVDCVLNDGAPNVGSAWVQDAFSQAELTLSALKLACAFLREGGWFITKVFRSKDYQPLMWVLQQLFKKVHATKPQASRSESAEIFVVCKGYIAPRKIDPKLLDPRYVFEDKEDDEKPEQKISLTRLQKPSKSAKGYPDDARVLFKATSVADFITGDDYLTVLTTTNKLEFDKMSEVFSKHPLTTDEIKQSCEDVKVLGPRELKLLVKWREKMRKFLDKAGSDDEEEEGSEADAGGSSGKSGEERESNDKLLDGIDDKIESLKKEEAAEVKREIKRLRKQRRKLKERLVTKGDMYRETSELTRQEDLFRLANIKSRRHLEEVEKGEMAEARDGSDEEDKDIESDSENEESDTGEMESDTGEMESDVEEMESDMGEVESDLEDNDNEAAGDSGGDESNGKDSTDAEGAVSDLTSDGQGNPLLISLENSTLAVSARSKKAKLWFSKSAFEGLEDEEDEDIELDQMVSSNKGKNEGKMAINEALRKNGTSTKRGKGGTGVAVEPDDLGTSSDEDSDSDDSEEDDVAIAQAKAAFKKGDTLLPQKKATESESFEVVPARKKILKLDPEGLAIGALMVQSKKKREDLIESGYNRWTHNDDNLPDWFLADESKYCQKTLPITKEMVEVYRSKLKEINSRPIKKIAEAKARKKKRALRKLEKARKKAESIADLGDDFTAQEKAQQIKQVYKKAGVLGKRKREVEYVVAKRGVGKRVKRPAGVKGHFKVVDPRMKKDARGKTAKGRSSSGKQNKRKR